jgi:hypothetical protein
MEQSLEFAGEFGKGVAGLRSWRVELMETDELLQRFGAENARKQLDLMGISTKVNASAIAAYGDSISPTLRKLQQYINLLEQVRKVRPEDRAKLKITDESVKKLEEGMKRAQAAFDREELARQRKEADSLMREFGTAQERMAEKMAKLNDAWKSGALSIYAYNRALAKYKEEALGVPATTPAGVARGTAEAYQIIEEHQNKLIAQSGKLAAALGAGIGGGIGAPTAAAPARGAEAGKLIDAEQAKLLQQTKDLIRAPAKTAPAPAPAPAKGPMAAAEFYPLGLGMAVAQAPEAPAVPQPAFVTGPPAGEMRTAPSPVERGEGPTNIENVTKAATRMLEAADQMKEAATRAEPGAAARLIKEAQKSIAEAYEIPAEAKRIPEPGVEPRVEPYTPTAPVRPKPPEEHYMSLPDYERAAGKIWEKEEAFGKGGPRPSMEERGFMYKGGMPPTPMPESFPFVGMPKPIEERPAIMDELPKEIAKAVKYPHIREIKPDTRPLAEKYPHAREFAPKDERTLAEKYPHITEEKDKRSLAERFPHIKEPGEKDKFGVQSLARTVERAVKAAPKPEEEGPKLTGEEKHARILAQEKAEREAKFVGPPAPALGPGKDATAQGVDKTNDLLAKILELLKSDHEGGDKTTKGGGVEVSGEDVFLGD